MLDHICFIYIENRYDSRQGVPTYIQRVNYFTILRKMKVLRQITNELVRRCEVKEEGRRMKDRKHERKKKQPMK